MHIGYQSYKFNYPEGIGHIRPAYRQLAQTVEAAGFASLWLVDHFFQMPGAGDVDEPVLEVYTTLGYLAALTERITLGALVTGVVYRTPGLLIKTLSTLDVLSGGRAWLGIGAAWYDREAFGLGFPFPPTGERFEQLEETLQIFKRLFADNREPITGQHYQLAEPINSPTSIQRPHPTLMIGGEGEKKTLRMVAQYADACNFFFEIGHDGLRHKLSVLRGHCDAIGRDYDTVIKTCLGSLDGKSTGELVDLCGQLGELGFSHVIFNSGSVPNIDLLERIGHEVIPQVRDL